MKRSILVFSILLVTSVVAFAEKVEIKYIVGKKEYSISVSKDEEIVTIANSTESSSISSSYSSNLVSITGLEKLRKLKVLRIAYFKTIGDIDFHNSTIEILVVLFSTENNMSIRKALDLGLKAVLFQSCTFTEDPIIHIETKNIEYIEISNSNLAKVPQIVGNIKYVSLIYNKIQYISESEWTPYKTCSLVLLQGNGLKLAPGENASIVGGYSDINKLLPIEYSKLAQ